MVMGSTALAWFRRDLRLHDNPAWAAATAHDRAAALVVIEPALLAAAGPYRRRAYVSAVAGLEGSLRHAGGRLQVVRGDPAEVVPRVAEEVAAEVVIVNSDVTRWSEERDRRVQNRLDQPLESHWGTVVHPPGSVLTRSGTLSRVFTPFYRRWKLEPLPVAAHPGGAEILRGSGGATLGDVLGDSADPPWGEDDALERLRTWLLDGVDEYHEKRDRYSEDGASGLSAELRFGLLSPREVVAAAGCDTLGRAAFVRQLAWRDWYAHLTAENPEIDRVALRPEYDRIEWASGQNAEAGFEAWRTGRTGYPIVDAAMRELALTGKMHNRLRMVAASFLVKNLLIDWRRGERWFRRLLIDGDIPQNAGNWQWVAGTGPDAAPYFRIFNPVTQSRRFDPRGDYLRCWLPELARLDSKAIHAPWEAGPLVLAAAGVTLGITYPHPIVEHSQARTRALETYRRAVRPTPQ